MFFETFLFFMYWCIARCSIAKFIYRYNINYNNSLSILSKRKHKYVITDWMLKSETKYSYKNI